MTHQNIKIDQEFVTLGQLLKMVDLISSGGMAKWYLSEFIVNVNGQPENRRGRKIYPGDQIEFFADDLSVTLSDN